MIKSLITKLILSFLKPENKRAGNRPIKEVLKLPIIFDLTSYLIQLRYVKRIIDLTYFHNSSKYIKEVKDYNFSVTNNKLITRSRRAEIYYQISSIIINNLSRKKILIVGPRNVQELYMAWLYGFEWKEITAIDLYSTHPKIKVMDMHNMTFKDESFDCVVMANTLAYADNTEKVIREVSRVLKPKGVFSFGATFNPAPGVWKGSKIDGKNIYDFLKSAGMQICLHLPEEKITSRGLNQTTNNFSAQKIDLNEKFTDNFNL